MCKTCMKKNYKTVLTEILKVPSQFSISLYIYNWQWVFSVSDIFFLTNIFKGHRTIIISPTD